MVVIFILESNFECRELKIGEFSRILGKVTFHVVFFYFMHTIYVTAVKQ